MSEIELLPCPFCGGEAKLHHNLLTDKFKVWCSKCDCRTDVYSDKEEAIRKWNTRKPMERILERLKGIVVQRVAWFGKKDEICIGVDKAIKICKKEGGIE